MGFSKKITSLIQSLYIGQESAVRLESGNTDCFPVKKDVRQGCILSPSLFSIYTENIMRQVEAEMSNNYAGIKINGEELWDLRYADDTALLADTTTGMEHPSSIKI